MAYEYNFTYNFKNCSRITCNIIRIFIDDGQCGQSAPWRHLLEPPCSDWVFYLLPGGSRREQLSGVGVRVLGEEGGWACFEYIEHSSSQNCSYLLHLTLLCHSCLLRPGDLRTEKAWFRTYGWNPHLCVSSHTQRCWHARLQQLARLNILVFIRFKVLLCVGVQCWWLSKEFKSEYAPLPPPSPQPSLNVSDPGATCFLNNRKEGFFLPVLIRVHYKCIGMDLHILGCQLRAICQKLFSFFSRTTVYDVASGVSISNGGLTRSTVSVHYLHRVLDEEEEMLKIVCTHGCMVGSAPWLTKGRRGQRIEYRTRNSEAFRSITRIG